MKIRADEPVHLLLRTNTDNLYSIKGLEHVLNNAHTVMHRKNDVSERRDAEHLGLLQYR